MANNLLHNKFELSGKSIEGAGSWGEAIELGGVDWTVHTATPTLDGTAVKGYRVNYRYDDNGNRVDLGIVSPSYGKVSMRDFETAGDLLHREGFEFLRAGALNDGRTAFVSMRLRDAVDVGNGDTSDLMALVRNGWAGRTPADVFLWFRRKVCANGLVASVNRKLLAIRHTSKAGARVRNAETVLAEALASVKKTEAEYIKMLTRDVSREEASDWFDKLLEKPVGSIKSKRSRTVYEKNHGMLMRAYLNAPGAHYAGETAWGLYNAATYVTSHEGRAEGARLFASFMGGATMKKNRRAHEMALALCDEVHASEDLPADNGNAFAELIA